MDTSKHLPRDVFLHLLVLVLLVMVSINVGTLLFQFVNIGVPDVVADQYRIAESYQNAIRWSVASLVVAFPVFVWVMWFLKRDVAANPEKRDMKVRRWVFSLMLFVAGAVLIGDLVALVYGFLQGELTVRFLLKIVAILVIAGATFSFYLNELRDRSKSYRVFSWAVIVLVAASMIAGVAVAGLPQSRRLVRLDSQRSADLSGIYAQVLTYWQAKSRLPANPVEIQSADIYGGWQMPTDPVTGEAYEYRVLGTTTFELCATFQADGEPSQQVVAPKRVPGEDMPVLASDFSQHGVGRTCFERTIDPDFLKQR